MFNPSYVSARQDIVTRVPAETSMLLDIGCSVGALGSAVMFLHPHIKVCGLELDESMAAVARETLHEVHVANLDEYSLVDQIEHGRYDCIVMADILEHLRDPWRVFNEVVEIAAEGATIIACVPNVRHIDTLFNLVLRGRWPYRDRGIHDRTHLRFFTRKNLVEMVSVDELSLCELAANYRLSERSAKINKVARYLALPGLRDFLAFQYIAVLKKSGGTARRVEALP